jgi:hypothetical protein
MIVNGSRYQNQPVLVLENSDGSYSPAVFGPTPTPPSSFSYYVVAEGDRFDTLAYKFLGNVNYWWKIADANPEVFYPEQLMTGALLRIPAS